MDVAEFLAGLGLTADPFESTNADEEEHLHSYFIPPPYFDSVWGDPDRPKTHVIFADRGRGKSAQRRMVEYKASENDVFAITYDRFEHLESLLARPMPLEYHLENLSRLMLLGFLLKAHTR
jgi:hypothetical protein